MANNRTKTGSRKGRDATHRAQKVDTHPTHGCIKHFCGFEAMLIASPSGHLPENRGIPPFFAMADSISSGAKR